MPTYPNKNNFCGGAFQDWLEVNLLKQCNAKCSWCVEKVGYHPTKVAGWEEICSKAIETGKKNIILLGGEPTLYPNLKDIIQKLYAANKNVYITTNGGMLSKDWARNILAGVKAVNISLHHYKEKDNRDITGIMVRSNILKETIEELHSMGISVRLNCNCISGYIDSVKEIRNYISFGKSIGTDRIRFAELKQDKEHFVDLAKLFNYEYGLNDDPFTCGCNLNVVVDGMPINFRQMCGIQTENRPTPIDPIQEKKQVLYYDGILYDGWQIKEKKMTDKELMELLIDVADAKITPADAKKKIKKAMKDKEEKIRDDNIGCQY